MSKRPELRRLQREAQKKFRPSNAVASNDVSNVLFGSRENVMKNFGLNVQELKVYLERMESEMRKISKRNVVKKSTKQKNMHR